MPIRRFQTAKFTSAGDESGDGCLHPVLLSTFVPNLQAIMDLDDHDSTPNQCHDYEQTLLFGGRFPFSLLVSKEATDPRNAALLCSGPRNLHRYRAQTESKTESLLIFSYTSTTLVCLLKARDRAVRRVAIGVRWRKVKFVASLQSIWYGSGIRTTNCLLIQAHQHGDQTFSRFWELQQQSVPDQPGL